VWFQAILDLRNSLNLFLFEFMKDFLNQVDMDEIHDPGPEIIVPRSKALMEQSKIEVIA
jgi:hypothetical protein